MLGTREHQSTFNNNGFKQVHVEYADPVAQPETTVIPSFCILPKERQFFLYILLKNTVSYVDWLVKMEENHSLKTTVCTDNYREDILELEGGDLILLLELLHHTDEVVTVADAAETVEMTETAARGRGLHEIIGSKAIFSTMPA